jgi:hypothetical protein
MVEQQARIAFRDCAAEAKEEAIAEVVASAACAYRRLYECGELERAFASALVRYAVAQFRVGRRVGGRLNVHDVMSPHCRRRKGVSVRRLSEEHDWREMLADHPRSTPADIAAIRIDFKSWLRTLNGRDRRIVRMLAIGETTKYVARAFCLTAGRVSQLRREFHTKWQAFIGELQPTAVAMA